jgi:hypothetical protein
MCVTRLYAESDGEFVPTLVKGFNFPHRCKRAIEVDKRVDQPHRTDVRARYSQRPEGVGNASTVHG